jgi:hypothetical protein
MATSTLEIEDISYGMIVMRHNYLVFCLWSLWLFTSLH